ncbi:hypothetical protein RDI58_024333 [Solanum bulbocastanum]|uniref:Uncharacterized protein n=1 Tax=Solanum bulbocastanum TaxID=147425 RepID=A0AAN8SZT1_SOLBU
MQCITPEARKPAITHRSREQNQVDDKLAKKVVTLMEDIDLVEWIASPMFIMRNIDADNEEATFFVHDMPFSILNSLTIVVK